jgi:hypothetical protein
MAKNAKATAPEAVEEKEIEKVETVETAETPKATAPEAELIDILIQEDPLNPKDNEVIVGINDKYAKIIRGVPTKVTRPVWEQLRNAKLV